MPDGEGDVLITGIGKSNAAYGLAKKLREGHFERVVNLGICGAVDEGIPLGSIFSIRKVVEGDRLFSGRPSFFEIPVIPESSFPSAVLVTQDGVMRSEKQRNHIKGLGAMLCDMECFALAGVAAQFKIPFFAFKAVSDHAEENAHEAAMKNATRVSKELCRQIFNLFFSG